jgi:hypothetical protein
VGGNELTFSQKSFQPPKVPNPWWAVRTSAFTGEELTLLNDFSSVHRSTQIGAARAAAAAETGDPAAAAAAAQANEENGNNNNTGNANGNNGGHGQGRAGRKR